MYSQHKMLLCCSDVMAFRLLRDVCRWLSTHLCLRRSGSSGGDGGAGAVGFTRKAPGAVLRQALLRASALPGALSSVVVPVRRTCLLFENARIFLIRRESAHTCALIDGMERSVVFSAGDTSRDAFGWRAANWTRKLYFMAARVATARKSGRCWLRGAFAGWLLCINGFLFCLFQTYLEYGSARRLHSAAWLRVFQHLQPSQRSRLHQAGDTSIAALTLIYRRSPTLSPASSAAAAGCMPAACKQRLSASVVQPHWNI